MTAGVDLIKCQHFLDSLRERRQTETSRLRQQREGPGHALERLISVRESGVPSAAGGSPAASDHRVQRGRRPEASSRRSKRLTRTKSSALVKWSHVLGAQAPEQRASVEGRFAGGRPSQSLTPADKPGRTSGSRPSTSTSRRRRVSISPSRRRVEKSSRNLLRVLVCPPGGRASRGVRPSSSSERRKPLSAAVATSSAGRSPNAS
jgi:hypothetical protein